MQQRLALIALLVTLIVTSGSAQDSTLSVRFTEIDLARFPAVQLNLRIQKPANTPMNVSAGNAILTENGIPQIVEYFECPQDSSTRLSIAILLDRSSSMRRFPNNDPDPDSTKIRAAKAAIRTFLDLLGFRDEAAIFSFTTSPIFWQHIFTVEHDFSTDKDALKGSLAPIVADGSTRLWEAIIDAVDLLRVRPGRKALIVVTDGKNRFGNFYRTTAFQRAVDEGIPVYPIGIGDDIDMGALSSLASTTGGSFYPAPDAADLEAIFSQLGEELITDDCVLRYTSSNPCLDGTRRDIELALSGIGFLGEADTFYVLPRQLSPVTLIVENGVRVVSRDTAIVPLTVLEQFSTTQPISYSMTVGYDASIMQFQAIRTEGTMSEGYQVAVTEATPGLLQLELQNFVPAYATGTLCELEFGTFARKTDTTTAVSIRDAEISGRCPMELTARDSEVRVEACTGEYYLWRWELGPFADGEEFIIPIQLIPPVDQPNMQMDLSEIHFRMGYHVPIFTYLGIEIEGTIAASADVLVQHEEGNLAITVSGIDGLQPDTLILLRFRAKGMPQAEDYIPSLEILDFITGCDIQLIARYFGISVDGICQPLVQKKRGPSTVSNYPNPFTERTTLTYTVRQEGNVELYLLDRSGRRVRELLNAYMKSGTYEHSVDLHELTAGEYLAVLRAGEEMVVRKMLIVR